MAAAKKTAPKEPQQQEIATETPAPVQEAAPLKPAPQAKAVQALIGINAEQNAKQLEAFLAGVTYPVKLNAQNLSAMRFVLPIVVGFKLGSASGKAQDAQCCVTIKSAEQLHRLCLDIQEILKINKLAGGIVLTLASGN